MFVIDNYKSPHTVNGGRGQPYLAEIFHKVVLQKSIPAQIWQLILYISNNDD